MGAWEQADLAGDRADILRCAAIDALVPLDDLLSQCLVLDLVDDPIDLVRVVLDLFLEGLGHLGGHVLAQCR